jgi:hypothetical protein
MLVGGQLHARTALFAGKVTLYALDKKLGGPRCIDLYILYYLTTLYRLYKSCIVEFRERMIMYLELVAPNLVYFDLNFSP